MRKILLSLSMAVLCVLLPMQINAQVTAPYVENFDNNGTIPTNWAQGASNSEPWRFNNGAGAGHQGNVNNLGDHTVGVDGGSGYYAWVDDSTPDNLGTTLESPTIDASSLIAPEMRLWINSDNEGNTNVSFSIDFFDGAAWNTGVFTHSGNTSGWQEVIVSLSSFTITGPVQFRFIVDENNPSGQFYDDFAIDDFSLANVPTCPQPSNLTVGTITSTTADLTWTTGGATDWLVEYGPFGFTPGTGTTVVVSTTPSVTLSSLSAATSYDVYVMDSCGIADISLPISTNLFTNCGIVTAPFVENFDDPTWVASGTQNGNQINQCWTSTPDVTVVIDHKWIPRSTGPTSGNGPLNDVSGGNFMYCEESGSTGGQIADLVSPVIDVSGLTTPALYFNHHRFSGPATIPDMDVDITNDNGSTWTTVYSITGDIQTSAGDAWSYEFVNLAAYTGDTIQVRFRQIANGCCGDAAIDSIVVDEAPTCPWPTGVTVLNVSDTSAVMGWSDPSGTTWDMEWGPSGFTPGTGAIVTTTNNPDTLYGLFGNTTYDFYVRANCTSGGNGTSIWIGPLTFKTECSAFTAPYTENWDTYSSFTDISNIDCWSFYRTGTNGFAQTNPTPFNGPTPVSSPMQIEIGNGNNFGNVDTIALISPRLTDLDDGTKQIRFWAAREATAAELTVGMMSDLSDPSTFVPVQTITNLDQASYRLYIITLDTQIGNGEYIVFANTSTSTFSEVFIDDFVFEDIPQCAPSLTAEVNSTNATSADVSWVPGAGVSWVIEWGPTGFTQGTNPNAIGTSIDTNFVISGLDSSACYDFYVRDSCSDGSASAWAGPFNFCTKACSAPCIYTINMFDTFGDGWNNGSVDIAVGNDVMNFTFTTGSSASATFPVCNGIPINFFWNTGIFDGEVSFDILDPTGAIVFSQGPNPAPGPAPFHTMTGNCNFPCLPPHTLSISNEGLTDAQLDWTSGGATDWIIEWGPVGFTPGTGQGDSVVNTSSNPFIVTGLDSATCYDVYVRDSCGPGLYSNWAGPIQLCTDICSGACVYTIDMFDTFGDGWNNGTANITVAGQTTGFTFTTGSSASATFQVCPGAPVDISWSPGIFDGEVSFDIKNLGGQIIFSQGPNPSTTGLLTTFTGDCTPITCPFPSGPGFISSTQTSADLFWTTGGASDWQVEYGPIGFTQGTGTIVGTSNDTVTLTSLTVGTAYEFYVRDSCGAGDVSFWVGPVQFNTLCNIFTTPYLETFDGSSWISGTGSGTGTDNITSVLDPCWTRSNVAGAPLWGPRNIAAGFGNGPNVDHTSGSGQFMYTAATFAPNGTTASLVSPPIDLTPLDTPELRFWYHRFSNTQPIVDLDVSNDGGATWTNVLTQTGQAQANANAPWLEAIVDISAFADDTIIFRFEALNPGCCAEQGIDDISIIEKPTCIRPTNIGLVSAGTNSLDIEWTTGGASDWQIHVDTCGGTLGQGTIINASNDTVTIPGLMSGQCYQIYVRDSCGPGEVSLWEGPFTVSTLCTVFPAPYTQNFDGPTWVASGGNAGNALNSCWSSTPNTNDPINDGEPFKWIPRSTGPTSGNGPLNDHTTGSGKFLYTEASGSTTGDIAMLVSPSIDLTTLTVPEMRFWYHRFSITQPDLDVEVTNDGGATWTNVFNLTGQTQANINDPWLEAIVNISAFAGDTIQIRFVATGFGCCADQAIDDFAVIEAPTCPRPSALGSIPANTTISDIDVFWTTAGASAWQVTYGSTGFNPNGGTGTIIGALNDTTTISGLDSATCYDVYVRDSCGPGDVSLWEGPINVCTKLCSNSCIYTIDMFDTFGDGWNGGTANISLDGNVTPFTFTTGTFASATFEVCTGTAIDITWSSGAFDGEVSFNIIDGNGITLFSQGPNPPVGSSLFATTANCAPLTCPAPTAAGVGSVAQTTAQIFWTTGGASDWEIEYEIQGFVQGTGMMTTSTNDTLVLSGLTPGTCYEYYVRDSCGPGDVSFWTGPISFCTPCVVTAAPYLETFDGASWFASGSDAGNMLDVCWFSSPNTNLASNDGEPFKWIPRNNGPSSGNGPLADHTTGTGNFLYTEASGSATGDIAILTTPPVDLSPLTNPEFTFWFHRFSTTLPDVDVEVTNDGGATWSKLMTLTGQFQATAGDPWQDTVVQLSSYANDTVQVRFTAIGFGCCADQAIDDVEFRESTITCPGPTALGASNLTSGSADLSWTTGGATDWIIQWGPQGFTPGTGGSGTFVSTSTNPHTLGGLMPSTCYDYYVQDSCGPNDISAQTGPFTFCTTASGCPIPVASFTFTPPAYAEDSVTFDASGSSNADSLYWDFGDGSSDTGMIVSHVYAVNDTFTVSLTVCASCSTGSDSCVTITQDVSVFGIGIEESVLGRSLELYPNPTNDVFGLKFTSPYGQDMTIRVVNTLGQIIYTEGLDNFAGKYSKSISIGDQPKGIYFLQIITQDGVINRRVALQ